MSPSIALTILWHSLIWSKQNTVRLYCPVIIEVARSPCLAWSGRGTSRLAWGAWLWPWCGDTCSARAEPCRQAVRSESHPHVIIFISKRKENQSFYSNLTHLNYIKINFLFLISHRTIISISSFLNHRKEVTNFLISFKMTS